MAAESIPRTAAETAVGLVTRLTAEPGIPDDQLLDGADPAGVLLAMALLEQGILGGVWPADEGMAALARIGAAIADPEVAES